jgi:C-terminal processing protease CtpA/Prc
MLSAWMRRGTTGTIVLAALLLAGCGGGGGGSSASTSTGSSSSGGSTGGTTGGTTSTSTYVPGQYPASSNYVSKCANPRSGTDPLTNVRYGDVQGTVIDENNYLRSWTNELYLWFDQVPDLDPSQYTTASYFALLKTSAKTPSGAMVDKPQFHFTYPTSTWEALSMQGIQAGYGINFDLQSPTPPRDLVVAYVDAGATGSAATVARGAVVESIDGVDVNDNTQAGVNTLNAGLQPATAGETHTFSVLDLGSTVPRTVVLTAANVTMTPVPVVATLNTANGKVGYILFNDHIATAESELITAFTNLQQQGVSDLVLDLRYNGGGYLDIASEVAFMIAGSARTSGRTFELQQFNSKNPATNPVVGGAIMPTLFHSTSLGFSGPTGQALPSLNLAQVFVLTGSGTCSASESVINSLRGVNVKVIEIGSTTCGKPYGFYPQPNCGTTYFSIQFRGVNDQGFGEYSDGFSPANAVNPPGVLVPGCSVADDFGHALGDANEGRLAQALAYRTGGVCTVPPSGSSIQGLKRTSRPGPALSVKSPLRENRILRPQ